MGGCSLGTTNIRGVVMGSIVLLSGGLDSVTLAERERRAGTLAGLVFVDYAHPAQVAEGWRAFAYHGRHGVPLKVVHAFGLDLGGLETAAGDSVMPSRNLVLLASASNVGAAMGGSALLIGATRDDARAYPDCRRESLDALSAAFVLMGGLPIEAPFAGISKSEVVDLAMGFGITSADVWSCYRGGFDRCGACASCLEAAVAWGEEII